MAEITKREKMYPDKGGYTGYSLFIWYVTLQYIWGGLGTYIFEGRYFIRGVLLNRILEISDNFDSLNDLFDEVDKVWKTNIDKV